MSSENEQPPNTKPLAERVLSRIGKVTTEDGRVVDNKIIDVPQYYYYALLKIAAFAEERMELKDKLYETEKKLTNAIYALKRPELQETVKS